MKTECAKCISGDGKEPTCAICTTTWLQVVAKGTMRP